MAIVTKSAPQIMTDCLQEMLILREARLILEGMISPNYAEAFAQGDSHEEWRSLQKEAPSS